MHSVHGIYKKLELKGKSSKKGYQGIARWSRSISNHMYWCAASSNGNGEELVQKWQSVLKHCANVHDGHGDLFPNCLHGPLEDREWIKMGSPAYIELEKVICGRMLLKDIKKLSPAEQTSGLESFHNIVCYFAPKSTHFSLQMRARLFLSVLHFNENTSRSQATTAEGRPQFSISYPKGRKGDAIAKEVKVKQTFDIAAVDKRLVVPPPLADQANRQEKENVIQQHVNRFNNE
ncbi:unnamed protein product [Mytilus edulis]|uniref:Uncharacterized protein n=1 Tax=Mytilus edulis TaxID=6550 RepID=A0A8S3U409_MYTED|nr:unnamed protein product [Mytilus edulis]